MKFINASFETSFGSASQLTESDIPEIVVSGRSNVGKSSLINRLCSRKNLARTSASPGKTATINFFLDEGFRIVDLPGYGYAKVSKTEKNRWNTLISSYFSGDRDIRLVLQLVDIRHAPSVDDINMINFFIDYSFPFIVVFTKSDKLSKRQCEERMEKFKDEIPCFSDITHIITSSEKGEGFDSLKEIIESVL